MRNIVVVTAGLGVLAIGARAEDGKEAPPAAPAPVDVPGFWTADELRRIDQGLDVLNCTRKDLGFQKRPIEDPFRLTVVNRILDEPLAIGPVAAEWDEVARTGDPDKLLRHAFGAVVSDRVRGGGGSSSDRNDYTKEVGDHLPVRCATALREFVWDLIDYRGCLTGEEQLTPSLLRKALASQVEHPQIPIDAPDIPDAEFLEAVQKYNVDNLNTNGGLLFALAKLIKSLKEEHAEKFSDWKGMARAKTNYMVDYGDVVIYGVGDDVHGPEDDNATLVIDLGGNDTYTRGASVNFKGPRQVSIVIDLSGDDRYLGGNDFSFGGALGGVAIQWDCAGDDVYLGGNCSCGAGILGVGVLVDEGGNDIYRCKDFGEGAGAFGIGLLLDKGGNDVYHADLYGQGFASTWGCGMLVEMAGNDVYDAGGAHLHAPLWRDRFQSLSQGFSIGMRPDASGGVGVLVDVSGNDRYSADIYGQGASYWYSLGLLIDDDGHDTYALGQYGQGSGIHLSAGMLLDRHGQDSYYDANGVGMGGAHDYSVGFLVDREGDDYYAGGGGAQGGALTNSVAMLIDDAGDDSYAATRDGTQGSATSARNTGGIGLLLDGAGADRYTETRRNDAVWTKDTVGAGLDEPTPRDKPSVNAMAAAISKEDAEKKVEAEGKKDGAWDLDKLWALVTQWEVGDNTVVMPIARERYFALGKPALDRAFANFGDKQGLVIRGVEFTVKHFAESDRQAVVARLIEKTRDPDKLVRKNAVLLVTNLQVKEALPRLVEMLTTDSDTTGGVLMALAAMKTAPPEVAGMLRHAREPTAVQAAVCLGSVADDKCVAALVDALGPDYAFPVRLAATTQLAALGEGVLSSLGPVAMSRSAPRMQRRNALRALGGTKVPEAGVPISAVLDDPDPLVRLSAMTAAAELLKSLEPRPGQWLGSALAKAHAAETDPLVKRLITGGAK